MSELIGKYGSFLVEAAAAVAISILLLREVHGGVISNLVEDMLTYLLGGGQ